MHLVGCLDPQEVTINGEKSFVPCGKCLFCRSARLQSLAKRIEIEASAHKYCVFVTLTYADIFLPAMVYDNYNRGFVFSNNGTFCKEDGGLFFNFPYLHDDALKSIDRAMKLHGFIPRLSKYDCQCFFKRLRINIYRKIVKKLGFDDEKEKFSFSYVLCGEYGPTTQRPHYHLLLFFDASEIAKNLSTLLHTAWPFGSSTWRYSSGRKSGRYVAQYLTCVYNLPSHLKSKEICPFVLVSKKHPIGCGKFSKETLQSFIHSGACEISVFDPIKGRNSRFLMWPFLENRLFPKFTGYNVIPFNLRIELLGYAIRAKSVSALEETLICLRDSPFSTFDYDHFCELFFPKLTKKAAYDSFTYSLYLTAKKIRRNMHLYCVNSVFDYVCLIDLHYENKEKYKLKQQLEFESSYDSTRLGDLRFLDYENYNDSVLIVPDVAGLLFLYKSIRDSSHKNKSKNEYLRIHPEYRLNDNVNDFLEGF